MSGRKYRQKFSAMFLSHCV